MSARFDIQPFGDQALLISSDRSLLGYRELLSQFGVVRGGMSTLLIEGIDPQRANEIRGFIESVEPTSLMASGKKHELKVSYDGPDLPSVAEHLGISVAELIATHSSVEWKVAMVGFAPGFGYLVTDDTSLFQSVPRLGSPRARVPAGSLALAAGMSAIYPSASPGGWQLIGTSSEILFDSHLKVPARLAAGDVVRFHR